MPKTQQKPLKAELLCWGYAHKDRGIQHVVNVIQCQCGNQYKKLLGLWRLVEGRRHEIRLAQFDLFSITIDGTTHLISALEEHA